MVMARAIGFCGVLLHVALLATGDEATANTTAYEAPTPIEGVHWSETFDGDVWTRWTQSTKEKYNGKFTIARRNKEGLVGDVGLTIPDAAKHYGASASFKDLEGNEGASFVVQFEARFQDGLSCGGAYMKLFDRGDAKPEDFDNDTPYIVMFGPDRCGSTDKVHFILKHRSPRTGEWEEKHFSEAPTVPFGQDTHLYGLVINPDNSVELQIDGVSKVSGNLLTSMNPAVNPPKEIDDPSDKKPEDWVDDAKMDDPASSKPDDWDEDLPQFIPDPEAKMPDGWLEDALKTIPDPAATLPTDWDEEEDGEWEAPTINNPACTVGCGKWEHPTISNPGYKGKWYAPKINNPEYKGVWSPRQIANPNYFHDETPSMLPRINSVGFDLWSMQGGIIFDNVVIATDVAAAKAFADQSFFPRKLIEDAQSPKASDGIMSGAFSFIQENMIAVGVTSLVLLIGSLWFCCGRSEAPPKSRPKKKTSTNGQRTEAETPADESKSQHVAEQEKEKKDEKAENKEETEETTDASASKDS
jgi:calnexin